MAERDKEWDLHFRTLSSMARDSNFASDPASDPSLLNSVKKLHELCKAENSEDLIARVYPQLNKIFQRSVASISQSRTSNGLLLLLAQVDYGVTNNIEVLVVALEKVERSSGSLIGSSIASLQKSAAPEMLLALMDEAYTGSTIGDEGPDFESEDSNTMAVADPLFLELLKDENDGLAERHSTSPAMAAALQVAASTPHSDRLKQTLRMTPRLLDVYFSIAVRDDNNSLICALIPLLMARNSNLFPDKMFSYEVQKRLLEFMLAAFQRSPDFVALLKKPIIDRLGEAYDGPAKTELALQLCWAIGEHGGGGESHKDAARELFESLELLLYENLSSSRLGLMESTLSSGSSASRKSLQSRLLCFVVTAIAKLATHHRDLLPRARVSLAKALPFTIFPSQISFQEDN
ncbi:hypothetical protein RHGRI_018556 [Rhododendron griersonianum]|uniref:ARM repeat superfamily protein n=1 Tax=Rhododendron griersonianum TaxID=479676 RepID=A0AAV6K1U2_9ERIC|nr:hypothetical protein RHGRI_018556 [Rhododendron griersonianum]